MSITARPASEADAVTACDVLRRSIRELCVADHGHDEQVLSAWLANKTPENVRAWITSASSFSAVAVDGSEVRGFGPVQRDGEIQMGYLVPEGPYRGAGKLMLRALEEQAARPGLRGVFLTSSVTARRFYEVRLRCGRCPVGDSRGTGILGHGSYSGKASHGGREITLIEVESVEALHRGVVNADGQTLGTKSSPGETRRNIATSGVLLNHLRFCEPCRHLEGLTQKGVLAGLIHRGGLRARILTEGPIRAGDVIRPDGLNQGGQSPGDRG